MHLDYIDDWPFGYLISDVNKDIKLSDEIKNEFNHYYINIRNSNNKDIDRCTQEAKRLKKMVELEILESGNQKSIYVTEYVQFIFGVAYLFFNKFHMTQKEVASILGMTTKFSKLDIFSYRCYSAFTKLDDLDLFTNISSIDKKRFVKTVPMQKTPRLLYGNEYFL